MTNAIQALGVFMSCLLKCVVLRCASMESGAGSIASERLIERILKAVGFGWFSPCNFCELSAPGLFAMDDSARSHCDFIDSSTYEFAFVTIHFPAQSLVFLSMSLCGFKLLLIRD
jgi:hypothetical protein